MGERDAFIPKSYNCGEMARFDSGRPVGTLAGSPTLVPKVVLQQAKALQSRLPSHFMGVPEQSGYSPHASASLGAVQSLQYNISPIQRTRMLAREDQERYLGSLHEAQQQQYEAFYAQQVAQQQQADAAASQAYTSAMHQQQQLQRQPALMQGGFLAATVNTRPQQPLSLEEAKEASEKRAKQSEYLRQLELTSHAAPIPTERISLARVTQQKRISTGEFSLQPAIGVQNVLTGNGTIPQVLSPEAKRKVQEEFRRSVQEAQQLPAMQATQHKRPSRPPSPQPVLGNSSLQPIGLRDSPEFKRQQHEMQRAMVRQGLQESGVGALQSPSLDGYRTLIMVDTGGEGGVHAGSAQQRPQQGLGLVYHSQQPQQGLASDRSLRAPLRRGATPPSKPAHVPSPAVQRVLRRLEDQRLAEDPAQAALSDAQTDGAIAAEEAEKRRQQQQCYSQALQADGLATPTPSSRIPVSSLRQANTKNDMSIYSQPQHTDSAPSIVDQIGSYEFSLRDHHTKVSAQLEYQRQLTEAAERTQITGERYSIARQSKEGLPDDPFKSYSFLDRPGPGPEQQGGVYGCSGVMLPEQGGVYGPPGQHQPHALGFTTLQLSTSTPSGLLAQGMSKAPMSRELEAEARRIAQSQRVALLQADQTAAPVYRERASLVSGHRGGGVAGSGSGGSASEGQILSAARSMASWNEYERAMAQQQQQQQQQGAMTSARKPHATYQMHFSGPAGGELGYGASYSWEQQQEQQEQQQQQMGQSRSGVGVPMQVSPRFGQPPPGGGSVVDTFKVDRERAIMRGHREGFLGPDPSPSSHPHPHSHPAQMAQSKAVPILQFHNPNLAKHLTPRTAQGGVQVGAGVGMFQQYDPSVGGQYAGAQYGYDGGTPVVGSTGTGSARPFKGGFPRL